MNKETSVPLEGKQKELFIQAVEAKKREFVGVGLFYEAFAQHCNRDKQAPQRWIRSLRLPKSFDTRVLIWDFLGYTFDLKGNVVPKEQLRGIVNTASAPPLYVTADHLIFPRPRTLKGWFDMAEKVFSGLRSAVLESDFEGGIKTALSRLRPPHVDVGTVTTDDETDDKKRQE